MQYWWETLLSSQNTRKLGKMYEALGQKAEPACGFSEGGNKWGESYDSLPVDIFQDAAQGERTPEGDNGLTALNTG